MMHPVKAGNPPLGYVRGFLKPLLLIVSMSLSCCDGKKSVDGSSSTGSGRTSARSTNVARPSEENGDVESIIAPDNGSKQVSQSEYLQIEKRMSAFDRTDLERILEKSGDDRYSRRNSAIFTLAVSELARRDPDAAMSWFQGTDMARNEPGFLQVAMILAKDSPQVLQAWLRNNLSKCNAEARADCLITSISALGKVDAKSAFAFLSTIESGTASNSDIINALFTRFGKQSPADAEQAAVSIYIGSDLDRARYSIASGAVDPVKAFEIAGKIRDISLRGGAVAGALSRWLDTNRPEALAKIKELGPRELQSVLQAQVFESGSLVNKLGKLDPDLLCGLLNQLTFSKGTEGIFSAAMDRLSLEAPEAADRLLASLPAGEAKNHMIGSRIAELAKENSSAALESASKLIDADARQTAYRAIGRVLGGGAADDIVTTAAVLPEGDRASLFAAALPVLARENPDEAVALIEKTNTLLAGEERQGVYALLGERLGRDDASRALQWLGQLGQDDQPAAMTGIATEMARADIQRLGKLLASMPQNRTWDAGVRVLVENLKDSDPELAKQWKDALNARGKK